MLRMPMIASQFSSLADEAIREKKSHIGYLEALLLAEIEERERTQSNDASGMRTCRA